jgi:hypothetical protein
MVIYTKKSEIVDFFFLNLFIFTLKPIKKKEFEKNDNNEIILALVLSFVK